MNAELLIIADRGQMKTYSIEAPPGETAAARLVDTFEIEESRGRFADEFTDVAGAFPNSGSGGRGNSVAERTQLATENELRAFRKLAAHIHKLIRQRHPRNWAFAAPAEINNAILADLPNECRQTLVRNLPKDLVNQPEDELLAHFRRV